MAVDANVGQRLQARIFREMQANRENPFNSPPSSTGSHGTISPTMSSFLSEPDAESTRRLNEEANRYGGGKKLNVNWEAAHRKWPEHFSKPLPTLFDSDLDTRPLSADSKENKKPTHSIFSSNFLQKDSTREVWDDFKRKRAEMQARVDDECDLSNVLSKSPAAALLLPNNRHLSPISRGQAQTRIQSPAQAQASSQARFSANSASSAAPEGRPFISEAINRLQQASTSPQHAASKHMSRANGSPSMSSAKSSLTAVPPSPSMAVSTGASSNVRSFFVPDISHLSDFVTGTLRFSGSLKNGVPIFVKQGKVIDRQMSPAVAKHTDVDAVKVPESEEKIFVSMDMIRNEIISLQQHHEEVQEYAINLQQQVERLEAQVQTGGTRNPPDKAHYHYQDTQVHSHLRTEISTLKAQLDQATRQLSTREIEKDSISNEKDRVLTRLQEACDDINKLTRKLTVKEKALETSQKQLDSSEQLHQDNDALRRDVITLSRNRDALKLEMATVREENDKLEGELQSLQSDTDSLCAENQQLRQQSLSLIAELKSLCTNNARADHNNVLNQNLDEMQRELDSAREEITKLRKLNESAKEELDSLRQDNKSLARQNERFFIENKTLQREVNGFERSVRDLHENNFKLKNEIAQLKKQIHHQRPASKADIERTENITSGFFLPDITLNTNISAPAEPDETKDLLDSPNMTVQSQNLNAKGQNVTAKSQNVTSKSQTMTAKSRNMAGHSQNMADVEYTESVNNTIQSTNSIRKKGHPSEQQQQQQQQGQKVAFSVPAKPGVLKTTANQGSKRRSASRSTTRPIPKARFEEFSDFDDTTGPLSLDTGATQDQVVELSVPLDGIFKPVESHEQTPYPRKTKNIQQHTVERDITIDSTRNFTSNSTKNFTTGHTKNLTASTNKSTRREHSRVLSSDARRVLDALCEHNCNNCIVCTRITSHRATDAELSAGKKRVMVSRPVPVTDRDLTVEDPTMRPFQSPGHALAFVIKGLEDESHHLQLELTQLQSRYNRRDKATGKKDRMDLAEKIRSLLKAVEVKNDQIYSLYDVLEGQKAAGQAMSEEELEMTVLNITGVSVHDLTEQLTWEGCQ